MITYKAIIIPGGRRKDGTYPIKIRITFKGVSRRLPTTLVARDADLTRSGRIKNATILEKAGELISRMRATTEGLSPFTLEGWEIDQVVAHIRTALSAESFRLDFFAWGREFIQGKAEGTRAGYTTALNALARFLGGEALEVNSITRALLVEFQEWADNQPRTFYNYHTGQYQRTSHATTPGGNSGRWLSRLAHIYQAAKERYNDEDSGRILIPRSPFDTIPRRRTLPQGQKALPVEIIQRIIDASPEVPQERIALAAFLVSLGTMGANLADLWEAPAFTGVSWRYNRSKTRDRRQDRAEVIVAIEPEIEPFLARLQTEPGSAWWLPALHTWKSSRIADTMVNKYLHQWCQREGLEPFTFYAARHSFATLARRQGVEKATIDEALGHIGDYQVADIYAERNWALAWEANRKVLELFRWPGSDNNRTKSGSTDGNQVPVQEGQTFS